MGYGETFFFLFELELGKYKNVCPSIKLFCTDIKIIGLCFAEP